ncbi:MAG: hypothetical protein IH588_08130 [Anaerolineales bacterium]|nr:hypothetical protein [Anaerolineales bacterium]
MQTETNDGKTVPSDKVTISAGWVAPTVDDAIETFRKRGRLRRMRGW